MKARNAGLRVGVDDRRSLADVQLMTCKAADKRGFTDAALAGREDKHMRNRHLMAS